jgi:hypothetical protein
MKNHFTIVYNKKTHEIESFVVPENDGEDLFNSVKLFDYQDKIEIDMKEYNIDVRELQKLLNEKLK